MELSGIDTSRVILFTQTHRPAGQLYAPEAIAKVIERYSFVKSPPPDQALPYTFGVGKFQDIQIAELSIYNDGVIASSASDTDLLDAFIEDLLSWAAKELQLVQLPTNKPERYYESSIVVKSNVNLTSIVEPRSDLSKIFQPALKAAKIDAALRLSGAIFDFDSVSVQGLKKKPFRLVIDRRLGVPFSDNVFYSQAPFRTKDHFEVLASLERLSSAGNG
jgi:hypothetical protein